MLVNLKMVELRRVVARRFLFFAVVVAAWRATVPLTRFWVTEKARLFSGQSIVILSGKSARALRWLLASATPDKGRLARSRLLAVGRASMRHCDVLGFRLQLLRA